MASLLIYQIYLAHKIHPALAIIHSHEGFSCAFDHYVRAKDKYIRLLHRGIYQRSTTTLYKEEGENCPIILLGDPHIEIAILHRESNCDPAPS